MISRPKLGLILCVLMLALPYPASADSNNVTCATPNQSSQQSSFVGASTATGTWGARASIDERTPYYCIPGAVWGNASAWAMVQESTGSGMQYAQIGYFSLPAYNAGRPILFTQWNTGCMTTACYTTQTFPGFSLGTRHVFAVEYLLQENHTGRMCQSLDGVSKNCTPWDPYDAWNSGTGLWENDYFGEGHDLFDEVPGSMGQGFTSFTTTYRPTYGAAWTAPTSLFAMNQNPPYWQMKQPTAGGNVFWIWTGPPNTCTPSIDYTCIVN